MFIFIQTKPQVNRKHRGTGEKQTVRFSSAELPEGLYWESNVLVL